MDTLRSPYPYFGGKSKIAPLIWERFGRLRHYIEPFAGSLAVYLSCPPHLRPKQVTVNDLDGMITNFWRSVKYSPRIVAEEARRPRSELDLIACHRELCKNRGNLTEKLVCDPIYHDPKIAGWWVWGMSTAVGDRWLQHYPDSDEIRAALPKLETGGIHSDYEGGLERWMQDLADHLTGTRILCGSWERAVSASTLEYRDWDTGIFLDPPYRGEHRRKNIYTFDVADAELHEQIEAFCLRVGAKTKIALCGYEGDFNLPSDWECLTWKATGGYSHKGGQGETNASRERIWFSPAAQNPQQIQSLF